MVKFLWKWFTLRNIILEDNIKRELLNVRCIIMHCIFSKSYQDQLISWTVHFILNSSWRKYEPALHENEGRANKKDKYNERKIMNGVIADVKWKRNML